jgi:hypothetical protein
MKVAAETDVKRPRVPNIKLLLQQAKLRLGPLRVLMLGKQNSFVTKVPRCDGCSTQDDLTVASLHQLLQARANFRASLGVGLPPL